MCGIFAGYSAELIYETDLVSVSHRGPDARGFLSNSLDLGYLTLSHWRLSIIDLSHGSNQPFEAAEGTAVLTFNGEIYNYVELRKELRNRGHMFRTSGDTEVILEAWREWGEDCLHHFQGMFSFVLADHRRNVLFAARDRFGIKPLYFVKTGSGTAFASEIKQLLPLLPSRKVNSERARDFLLYGIQDHTGETMFEDVFQLRGGEYALINLKLGPSAPWSPKIWYSLNGISSYDGTFEEGVTDYRKIFLEGLTLHLRSDVPLGSCLSGGMDSSAIVCGAGDLLARHFLPTKQNVFHCTYPFPNCNELSYARAAAAQSDAVLHQITPNPDEMLAPSAGHEHLLGKIIWNQDEPLNNASIFSQYCIFREAARANIKVMLDGQGGDEQLASYSQFYGPMLLSLLARGHISQALHEANRLYEAQRWQWKNTLSSLIFWNSPQVAWNLLGRLALSRDKFRWATPSFLFDGSSLVPPWNRTTGCGNDISTSRMSRMLLTRLSIPMLLHWEDRNSMAHGIEARVPFIDHKLIELTLSLPDDFKIRNGNTKAILKSAMRGIVPQQILNRQDKMGFETPDSIWLRQDPGKSWTRLLEQSAIESPSIFNAGALMALWKSFLSSSKPASPVFWRAITFGIWRRIFDVET